MDLFKEEGPRVANIFIVDVLFFFLMDQVFYKFNSICKTFLFRFFFSLFLAGFVRWIRTII